MKIHGDKRRLVVILPFTAQISGIFHCYREAGGTKLLRLGTAVGNPALFAGLV